MAAPWNLRGFADAEPEAEALPREEMIEAGLRVEVLPGREHVLAGVKNTVRTRVMIVTPDQSAVATMRPPLQVVCVLDRSGSMSGERLRFAKKACQKLVKHLEVGDTLHLVTYSDAVQVVFENGDLSTEGKERLKSQIQSVEANGMTNLFAGMEKAVELLGGPSLTDLQSQEMPVTDSNASSVRRIFLFSDGQVNRGLVDEQEMKHAVAAWANLGITTSTFGIGTDFNEPLMRGIAEVGKGRYTYLESGPEIPKLVSKSVHHLLALYGSEATLEVRGLMHTVVSQIYGADEDDEEESSALPGAAHLLADLHYGNKRTVLLELEIAPPGSTAQEVFQAAEWTLSFQQQGAQAQFQGVLCLETTHESSMLGQEDVRVGSAFVVRRAADLDAEIANSLSLRNIEHARSLKSRQLRLISESLQAAQAAGVGAAAEAEMLKRVLERAEELAERLQNNSEDVENVRRQCIQEMDLNRAMSDAGWEDRMNSSVGSMGDVADMDSIRGMLTPPGSHGRSSVSSPNGSPRSTPPTHSMRFHMPGSPISVASSISLALSDQDPAADASEGSSSTAAPPGGTRTQSWIQPRGSFLSSAFSKSMLKIGKLCGGTGTQS
eukprot:TRINITY_DN24389_c0_g1_i1.p1 TRINITY_DN24389_c0_g1~~TRINITY_DN24389_c0_g1_i1.p1  ORF type:complete len:606 (+),score=119.92 TRINITY_DN24389_c0_g1_i1:106-1923(+)